MIEAWVSKLLIQWYDFCPHTNTGEVYAAALAIDMKSDLFLQGNERNIHNLICICIFSMDNVLGKM